MKNFWTPKVKIILAFSVAFAIVVAVLSTVNLGANPGEKIMGTLLAPLRSGAAAATRQVEDLYDYIFRFDALEAENHALKQKIVDMEEEVRDAQSQKRENERLTNLLAFSQDSPEYKFSDCYVTSWNSSNWNSTFVVSKGSKDGLELGMCAVTQYGQVLGVITEVGSGWATVTTVVDRTMQISASLTASGHTGVLRGSYVAGEEEMLMNYLPSDAVVKNKEQVVTTGTTLFPKGLLLGYVSDAGIDETGVGKYATVTPAADFNNLEQIFIITEYED